MAYLTISIYYFSFISLSLGFVLHYYSFQKMHNIHSAIFDGDYTRGVGSIPILMVLLWSKHESPPYVLIYGWLSYKSLYNFICIAQVICSVMFVIATPMRHTAFVWLHWTNFTTYTSIAVNEFHHIYKRSLFANNQYETGFLSVKYIIRVRVKYCSITYYNTLSSADLLVSCVQLQ